MDAGERLADRPVPLVIAEIGVNHNGSVETAKAMVSSAHGCGADVAKFQTFITDSLVSRQVELAEYQKRNIGLPVTQYDMIRALELSKAEIREVCDYCHTLGITFVSSVGEVDSATFVACLDVDTIKIGSADLTNLRLLSRVAQLGKTIWLSTGMGTLAEVESALTTLRRNGCRDIVIFHCTTNYPAPFEEANLRAIQTLRAAFGLPVGYSDHTLGIEAALGAVALGAVAIEKHFTLSRVQPGPDHKASMEPGEFLMMSDAIRNLALAMGDGQKTPSRSELVMRNRVRKFLVAEDDIQAGEAMCERKIGVKRTGGGLDPQMEGVLIGARARSRINKGTVLRLSMFDFEDSVLV